LFTEVREACMAEGVDYVVQYLNVFFSRDKSYLIDNLRDRQTDRQRVKDTSTSECVECSALANSGT